MRSFLFAVLAGVICFGCGKSGSEPPAKPQQATVSVPVVPVAQTIARLHWLGKKQIATATNSAAFMKIWNEPESARLETQTLDKLSTAPWRLFKHAATTNTDAAKFLRPLLDDCVQRESYLEISETTNHTGELAWAIRLPADRAALWQTNLAAVLESLTGLHVDPAGEGWALKKHVLPNLIQFTRAGDWAVVGLGQDRNALVDELVSRIRQDNSPLLSPDPESWVNADVDLPRVAAAFNLHWVLPTNTPAIALQATGDGRNVLTRGALSFPQPLDLNLEAWNLPTNLVHGQLGSFTAIRGIAPLIASQKPWTNLDIGAAPNQFFVWSAFGVPMQTIFAIPSNDASNRVSQINDAFMRKVEPWLDTNQAGHLELAKEFHGFNWVGFPYWGPFLRSDGDFIVGGFFPNAGGKFNFPEDLVRELSKTNTIYYDWEITGPRIESWFFIGQAWRLMLHKSQLPPAAISTAWLQANTNTLGNCLTVAFQSAPQGVNVLRQSTGLGLTAFELHVLADWFESPEFPAGLNTFLGQPEILFHKKRPLISKPVSQSQPAKQSR